MVCLIVNFAMAVFPFNGYTQKVETGKSQMTLFQSNIIYQLSFLIDLS